MSKKKTRTVGSQSDGPGALRRLLSRSSASFLTLRLLLLRRATSQLRLLSRLALIPPSLRCWTFVSLGFLIVLVPSRGQATLLLRRRQLRMDFSELLLSCGSLRLARPLHSLLLVSGRFCSVFLSTKLLNLYSRLGDLPSAVLVFRHAPDKSVITWNSVISCCVAHGRPSEAVASFRRLMAAPGVRPDSFTFPITIKACQDLSEGTRVHALTLKLGFASSVFVSASLVHMYSRLRSTDDARKAFGEMRYRDLGSWNAIISGLCQNGKVAEAAKIFEEMMQDGVGMDKVTVSSVLPVCAPLENLLLGMWIHVCCIKHGLDSDLFVSNALIDMYAKMGHLEAAQRVLEGMETRDLVTWNSIISGYEQAGDVKHALVSFNEMKANKIQPDLLTLVSLASTVAQCGHDLNGRAIHCYVIRRGWDLDDIIVGNAIVDMYGKLSKVEAACKQFNRMLIRDVISWNTMITAYSQNGLANEAIEVYEHMQKCEVLTPIQGTLASVLPACSHVGALQHGMRIHGQSVRTGLFLDVYVATCLIDMYAKCGRLNEAMLFVRISAREKLCENPRNLRRRRIILDGRNRRGLQNQMIQDCPGWSYKP